MVLLVSNRIRRTLYTPLHGSSASRPEIDDQIFQRRVQSEISISRPGLELIGCTIPRYRRKSLQFMPFQKVDVGGSLLKHTLLYNFGICRYAAT